MKIVLIDKEEGQKIGGLGIYTHRIDQYLTSHGHQVYIFRFAKKQPREKHVLRLPYYLAEPRSFVFLPTEKTLSIIKKHLIKIMPDIVYTCVGLSPLDFFLPSLCHELKIPTIATWHADFNDTPSSYQLLSKSLFLAYLPFCRQLDLLHVFSDKLAKFYMRRGIDKKRLLTLPNGVNPNLYQPADSRFAQEKNIKRGVLFLGRLTLQKNPQVLLDTFSALNTPIGTKLILVGHGDLENELKEKYKDRKIIFTGAVKNEEQKIDIINSCQIFVQPSRFEGMSLALLEAMSCGLAVVTSDAGANGEVAYDAGIVIPASKIEEQLPLALKTLLEYPDFTKMLGKKARRKILNQYSQDLIFEKLIKSFEHTIVNYKKYGGSDSKPIDINRFLRRRFHLLFNKLSKLSSSLTEFS